MVKCPIANPITVQAAAAANNIRRAVLNLGVQFRQNARSGRNAVRFERALLQDSSVVPVVRVPDLYGVGDTVDVWDGDVVGATGRWNVANVWLRPAAPRARP